MQNFTLLEKIGSGSYSTVYRAKDLRTQQTVALKIMKFPYSKGMRLQDMELAALKKFRSNPCVIQLLECFKVDDVMHMVFELGGLTLIDYYRRHEGKFTEEEVKVIGYQIALALQDMHRCSYMHRDLKPENIMIDPETSTAVPNLRAGEACRFWTVQEMGKRYQHQLRHHSLVQVPIADPEPTLRSEHRRILVGVCNAGTLPGLRGVPRKGCY